MDVDSLSSLLTSAHVGEARHAAVAAVGPHVGAVQEHLLTDEDIVESILFSSSGSVARPSLREMLRANEVAAQTLRNARCVSRVWCEAAAKPLVVALLNRHMAKFALALDFFSSKRNGELTHETRKSMAAVSEDRDALRWLISGWENGFNSVVADDPGLDSIGPCCGVIRHLTQQKVAGPYLVIAPEAAWPSWKAALSGLAVKEAHSTVELDALFDAKTRSVVLTPLHPKFEVEVATWLESCTRDDDGSGAPPPEPPATLDQAMGFYSGAIEDAARCSKYVVLDDRLRHPDQPGVTMTDIRCNTSDVNNCVRLTHEPLPSRLEDLHQVVGQLSEPLGGLVDPWRLEQILQDTCRGKRAAELRHWAINAFLVPTMQSALSRVVYLRRLKRGGKPVIVNIEPPKGVPQVEVRQEQHWLVGTTVQLSGLLAKPELNGRVGAVHGFNAKTERFEVLLHETAEDAQKWITVRYANLVQVSLPLT